MLKNYKDIYRHNNHNHSSDIYHEEEIRNIFQEICKCEQNHTERVYKVQLCQQSESYQYYLLMIYYRNLKLFYKRLHNLNIATKQGTYLEND